ncbi:3-deoxy-manno-octulosonate cytidylyltransferase [Bacteroidia bacterium]|nr:3-deoxy-manno-octulosonate cytidylyltransferase [Bacteroidia bacterium]
MKDVCCCVGIIPSRYSSSRFPGKPLADINGKPMIQWVYEQTKKAFAHCFVATDDERIANAVAQFGGQYVMTKASHQSGTDRCAEAIVKIEQQVQQTFDVVVNVQGDEPLIDISQLEQIKACFDAPEVQIATLAKPFGANEDIFSPNTPKVVLDNNNNALYFSRSPIPYIRKSEPATWSGDYPFLKHVGLYAYRTDVLHAISALPQSSLEMAESLEQLRWLQNGYKIKVGITHAETYAVDAPEDVEKILNLLNSE